VLKRLKTKDMNMTKVLTRTALIITLAALGACGTIGGIGDDLSSAGRSISKSVN
jgi:predicted small secreted protein